MEIEFQLTSEPIAEKILPPQGWLFAKNGAWLEFRGVVRGEENGQAICALEYEAYPEMAEREIRRLLEEIALRHPCLAAKVIHRAGIIPVGDTAIYVGVASPHRGEAIALLTEFMDRLKQDVPIWKRGAIPGGARLSQPLKSYRIASRCLPCACRWPKALAVFCARPFARRKTCRHSTAPPATATRFCRTTPPNISESWTRFMPPTGNRAN